MNRRKFLQILAVLILSSVVRVTSGVFAPPSDTDRLINKMAAARRSLMVRGVKGGTAFCLSSAEYRIYRDYLSLSDNYYGASFEGIPVLESESFPRGSTPRIIQWEFSGNRPGIHRCYHSAWPRIEEPHDDALGMLRV